MPDDDLTTSEGVDEGSAIPEPTEHPDPTGPPVKPSGVHSDDPASPAPLPPPADGPGQQLAEGEG
jgi:hypothetical protein